MISPLVTSSRSGLDTTINLNFGYSLQENSRITMFQVPTLFVILTIVNIISLMFFGLDKLKSKKRGWRIPESRLLLIAFLGPFGAYAGMLLFRHKTRKVKFLLVPIFLLIHVYLILYFNLLPFETI
jgi:uncharacterized membrane protein YsdA (DUF1294 family)